MNLKTRIEQLEKELLSQKTGAIVILRGADDAPPQIVTCNYLSGGENPLLLSELEKCENSTQMGEIMAGNDGIMIRIKSKKV